MTVVTLVWRLVFLPDTGLLSVISRALGETPIAFLNDQRLALPAIAVTTIWWCLGLPMVLFLAAPAAGAARPLRGGSARQCVALDDVAPDHACRRSGVPSSSSCIIEIILQFQLFGQAQLMTLGGPNNSTRPIVLFIYEAGWRQWQLGYAAAAAAVPVRDHHDRRRWRNITSRPGRRKDEAARLDPSGARSRWSSAPRSS